jgi:hypothetical protein
MATERALYDPATPGELFTAERYRAAQRAIQEDIAKQIAEAKEAIEESGVARADNAEQFDNKTPKEWTDALDERYAPKAHDHEELAGYRRYIKQLEAEDIVVLEHKLGRFPLVDVYELLPIAPTVRAGDAIPVKFYLYYHHEERDRDLLFTQDRGRVRWPWGVPIEKLLWEYQVEWEDDDSLGDVFNDFLDAFFKPPVVDHMPHSTSPWIDDHREDVIADLKQRDEWPDIRWVMRPQKLVVGIPRVGPEEWPGTPGTPWVEVTHLSYDTLSIVAPARLGIGEDGNEVETIDLMILLRS